jgi:hypothetical protein
MPHVLFNSDTHKVLQFAPVYSRDSATPGAPVPLIGAIGASTRWQLSTAANGTGVDGTGVATVADPCVNYGPSDADRALTPGLYLVQLSITYSDETVEVAEPDTILLVAAV